MPPEEPDRSGSRAGRFHTTRWDDVLAARDPAAPWAREALAEFCRAYWYPLYAYVRRKGYPREQAEDLTQGFFSEGLARDFLRAADPARGRFRSFLLTAFENYVKNEHQRRKRVKRGGRVATVSIDAGDAAEDRYRREPADIATPERLYDRRWALTLLGRSLDRLERTMADRGNGTLFDGAAAAYAAVAAELGMTEGAVKVAAHRLRERLRGIIREEVAATVSDPAEIDEEIRDLFSALGS
jgi:RNA polymerase sigma factor (sigma-70 family)